jgi:hypothetical protein
VSITVSTGARKDRFISFIHFSPKCACSRKFRCPTTLKDEILLIQSKYPNHILLVQVGGFFEIYEYCSYMEEVAALLDLSIGGR